MLLNEKHGKTAKMALFWVLSLKMACKNNTNGLNIGFFGTNAHIASILMHRLDMCGPDRPITCYL